MASWLGHSAITFHHHPSPISITTKTGQTTNLLDLCKEATPPCRLNPLLFNGHLQTMWTATKGTDIPVYYKRQIFDAELPEYQGTFAVDFVVPPTQDADPTLPPRTSYFSDKEFEALGSADDETPMLIVLHGLSGGSYEIYLRASLMPLIEAGWAACVVNSRGCANSKITSSVLYNARATWDCRQIVKWAREKWPRRKLFGIGFSLGANIMTNYLGEEGDNCLLSAAVVCSSPWNLDVSSHALQRTWLGMEIYSKTMGSNMKRLFEKYVVSIGLFPTDNSRHVDVLQENPRVNVEKIRATKYLHEFDRELQGPTWGYPTEGAYYRDASSTDVLLGVRIPLFAINAIDDPIAHHEALPFLEVQANPYTVLCATALGGHLSWFETGGTRWFAKPAANFLMKMAQCHEVEPQAKLPTAPSAEGVSVAARASAFVPQRRRLMMVHDVK